MARATERQLTQLGPWASGANNVANETTVPKTNVRRLINGDFYPGGRARRRGGVSPSTLDALGANSGWSDGKRAIVRSGTRLCRFYPGKALETIYDGLDLYGPITYVPINQYVVLSDTYKALRVDLRTNTVDACGIQSPIRQPIGTAIATGGMDAGDYQLAITYRAANGERSGTDLAVQVFNVPQGGGIQLDYIPQPTDERVTAIEVWLTRPNGTQLLRFGEISLNVASGTLGRQSLSYELDTQFLDPLPPFTAGAYCAGRFMFADATRPGVLAWTPAFRPFLYNLADDWIALPDDITLVASTSQDNAGAAGAGVFVASGENTYFVGGTDPKKTSLSSIYGAGAVPGMLKYVNGAWFDNQNIPAQMLPVWLATNGVVLVGLPTGAVYPLTENKYVMDTGERGTMMLRERDSIRQILFMMQGPGQTSPVAATDSLVITRNGVAV